MIVVEKCLDGMLLEEEDMRELISVSVSCKDIQKHKADNTIEEYITALELGMKNPIDSDLYREIFTSSNKVILNALSLPDTRLIMGSCLETESSGNTATAYLHLEFGIEASLVLDTSQNVKEWNINYMHKILDTHKKVGIIFNEADDFAVLIYREYTLFSNFMDFDADIHTVDSLFGCLWDANWGEDMKRYAKSLSESYMSSMPKDGVFYAYIANWDVYSEDAIRVKINSLSLDIDVSDEDAEKYNNTCTEALSPVLFAYDGGSKIRMLY